MNNIANFLEIILFNVKKNANKEQNILPLVSTIKRASLFVEYLDIPRTSTTTLQLDLNTAQHATGAGIRLPADKCARVQLHIRSVLCMDFLVYAKMCF